MREIVARLILADLLLIPYKQTTLICDSAADTMPNNPTLGGHATTYLHWIGFVYFYCFLVHTFENFRAVVQCCYWNFHMEVMSISRIYYWEHNPNLQVHVWLLSFLERWWILDFVLWVMIDAWYPSFPFGTMMSTTLFWECKFNFAESLFTHYLFYLELS